MSKIIKRVRFITIVLVLFGINSCTKDDLSSNDNNFSIRKQQKFNPDDGYPFVLTEAEAPFQFAVYQEDLNDLLVYMGTTLEELGENSGYFILSLSADTAFVYYGFITETSSYYNPEIFIDDPEDPFIVIDDNIDDDMMYCCLKIATTDKERFDRWVERKVRQGREVTMKEENGVIAR